MKARIKKTGEIIEVEELEMTDIRDVLIPDYYATEDGVIYHKNQLDFNLYEPEEEVTIEGYVAIDEAYDACFLHTSKPHQVSQEIADTGDYNTAWESDGKTYLLDRGLFPDLDCDSEPIECKVTITIKTKKK